MGVQPLLVGSEPEVPFVPFVAGLLLWALVKLGAKALVSHFNPRFYEELKQDFRKRHDLYFGVLTGIVFNVASVTACGAAVVTTAAESDISGLVRPLNTAEQMCWGVRAIIYTQELPHFAPFPEIVIHHISSLVAVLSILKFNVPRRQIYLLWATLLSEFLNSARFLLKMHGKFTPRVSWWVSLGMAFTIAAFRMTGVFVAMLWVLQGGLGGLALVINVGSMAIYMVYMLTVVKRELERAKLLVLDMTRPAAFVDTWQKLTVKGERLTREFDERKVAEKWKIGVLGIATGFGLVGTELSAILLFEVAGNRASSEAELHSIAWVALQSVAAGLLGAYLTAPILQLTVGRYSSTTSSTRGQKITTTARSPTLCLPGGLLSAAAALRFSPTMATSVDKTAFMACMALSFPLMDAFRQVGCFYAGIGLADPARCSFSFLGPWTPGFSSTTRTAEKEGFATMDPPSAKGRSKTTKCARREIEHSSQPPPILTMEESIVPLPLIAGALSCVLYVSLVTAYLAGYLNLQHAATLSLVLYGIIRCDVEPRRNDAGPATMVLLLGSSPFPVSSMLLYLAAGLGYSAHRALLSPTSSSTSSPSFSGALMHDMILVASACLIHLTVSIMSLPRAARKQSSGRRPAADAEAVQSVGLGSITATHTKPPPQRKGKGKQITVIAFLALCLLLGVAHYFDCMPKQRFSFEEAKGVVKPNHALWNAAASWQFVTATTTIAMMPVVMAQALV